MEKSKKIKRIAIILAAVLILGAGALAVWLFAFQGTQLIKADGEYGFSNAEKIKAEPDAGFVIDGILDEAQYQNSNWLKLKNTEGGAGVEVAATSYFGDNGLYIVFDITESSRIYFNPNRPSYLNSCIEMYLASSSVASMSSNQLLEIDMLPNGDLSIRQRTAKDNWVNVASTDDMMAMLGATTKGGPVNSEECTGYSLELFMPWAYMEKLGMNIAGDQDFFYVNPVHITSYNYEGTESGTDRYWYSFATQLGGDGWNDVPQYFRLGAKGALGTVPVTLKTGANYTITGNDSVVTGMLTTVDIIPDAGYAISSILVNGQEYIHRVAYNKDGSITLQLRGQEGGLTVSATAEAVTEGRKTLSGSVQVHKLGGDTLEGVSVSYKGPGGEKPLAMESDGSFLLSDLEQGYYIITAEKKGYAPINRGIYLNRNVNTELVLEYQVFQTEVGYNWILDDQNDGVLNRFGGSGKILTVDSYNKFRIDGQFKYDTQLAEAGKGNNYKQQRAGIQIKFSNGKYWRVDLMLEDGVYKVQYATHSDGTLFTWKTVHTLTDEQIAKYCSQEGIQLSVLRDGNYAWVCLDGKPVAIEVLDAEYANLTAQMGFEGWVANQQIEEMEYNISETLDRNLRSFYFTTNTKWDISGQMDGVLRLPEGGSAAIPFYGKYTDVDLTLKNIKEHDTTGQKPGRTDILLEFDTNGDGKADKSVSFGIVCTDRANKICWVQTLGNADNYIPATRIKGLYKLSTAEAAKYLGGNGVELQVIRKGTEAYLFLEGEEIAIWDLTQNRSGVTAKTPVVVSVRHYDAEGDVSLNFDISNQVGDVKIDRIFKANDKWDLSRQYEGVVSLPGGGTDTSLQFFKQYQNIDLTVKAKENDATGKLPGRTDILFEFDLNNDGTMDKNVSFGIIQRSSGRCVIETLGWAEKYLPESRINELYELTYEQAQKYKITGIDFRVVRYETMVYLYLDNMQVAVFDLTQNGSGVTANTKANMFLRHYDAVANQINIPFKVTDQVVKPAVAEQKKPVFKPNYKWDLSGQYEGMIALPGGGTSAVTFYDSYTDFDMVIGNIKEHDTTGKKPGRTDILLEFDTNGDGNADKNVSFGIICTDRANQICWVQTLGNAENYIPATRIKGLYKLSAAEAAKYLSGEGVELQVIRKGTDVYLFLDGEAVAIWDLTQNGSGVTAKMPVVVSVRHYDAEGDVSLNFDISNQVGDVKIDRIFKANEKWDLSKEQQGIVSLPGGGTELTLQMLRKYQNIDLTVTAREHDTTGEMFGRTDVLFEFDLNNDGSMDKNVSFGIVQLAGGRCVLQTLGWADNHIPEKRINELYELTYAQAQKYKTEGIQFRVVRYETMVYLYLEDTQVAVFDLTQNNSGVTGVSKANVFLRHYDAVADSVVIPFKVTQQVEKPEIVAPTKPVFKPNPAWDLSAAQQGVVSLPGGGTNAVAFYEPFADIDLTITAKENKAADAENGGRTDVLFEFENGKNVSFGITKWSATSSCIVETLGNSTNHIPENRKNTLYTLTSNETDAYLNDGVQLRLVRSGTDVYVIVEGRLVAVFDLTQNDSGVTADMKATVSLRHYDAVTDRVEIPFAVTEQVNVSELQQLPKPVFKSNNAWDLSQENLGTQTVNGVEAIQGNVSLPGGGTNAVAFYESFTDMDLTITAKENKAADAANGGRTDVLFEFENGKNVSFGIVKWSDTSACIVETLGNSTNHIPVNRKNTLYTLTQDETDAYLTDGVQLRLVRTGTDVHVIVEGKIVAVFDLTQNGSGVTADMKATVSLRHYDAVTDQVNIPFTVSEEFAEVTVTDNSTDGAMGMQSERGFVGSQIVLTSKTQSKTLIGLKVDGAEVALNADGTYSFIATKTHYTVEGIFANAIFESNFDAALWDISGQYDGYVTVIGGGGSTAQPLQFAGAYQNMDLTINARDYADSSTAARTDVEFVFDNGQTVTFGMAYADGYYCIQTRAGTLLNWKRPYELTQAEIDQYIVDANEIAAGNEDGLDLRIIRYGTTMYLFIENKQVAICDLTKCANSAGDTASGITADTEMFVYLRHYDDKRIADVEIPFTISTEVEPVEVSVVASDKGTVTTNPVNYYVNNGRTSGYSDTHFMGEKITLTAKSSGDSKFAGLLINGAEVTLSGDSYSFTATKPSYEVQATFQAMPSLFASNYDAALWDLSGQHDGYVTVIGGGGATAQPLQFAGEYENIDLTINARDYADASSASRTDVEFVFDNGQTVTFGIAEGNKLQTRAGTLLSWKTPYDLNAAEKAQLVIDTNEIAAGNEDGLDLRIIRYGTTMYLFIENKQVAICDLTKCANSAGDKPSGITADAKMSIYLRHYDDVRTAGVDIPFTISTEVKPVEVSIANNDKGTVTTNPVNYYVNNGRTSKYSDTHFMGERITLTANYSGDSKFTGLLVNGAEVTLSGNSYSFTATESKYEIQPSFQTLASLFASNYDAALWDLSGQHDGYVTVIGGGGSTAQPLQFAGMYQNVDLTLNARDYADASTKSRTEFGFEFDVDGDGVINTAKGDQTVTFGIAEGDRIQTRAGTLLSWKTPYDLNAAEKAQLVIDANEIAAGNEDGLDLRVIRYGTTMYLFIENKQVAICDLTKCANSAGDTASGITAQTKMYIYLRHYDDARTAGVKIPFSISTEVKPVEVSIAHNDKGTVTANAINYYVNNGRTSQYSDTHFMGEKIVLTARPAANAAIAGFTVNGVEITLNADGTYSFTASKNQYEIHATFEE